MSTEPKDTRPEYERNPRGHTWMLSEDGTVDDMAYNPVDPHNGPQCATCGYGFCMWCSAGPDEDCETWADTTRRTVSQLLVVRDIYRVWDRSTDPPTVARELTMREETKQYEHGKPTGVETREWKPSEYGLEMPGDAWPEGD